VVRDFFGGIHGEPLEPVEVAESEGAVGLAEVEGLVVGERGGVGEGGTGRVVGVGVEVGLIVGAEVLDRVVEEDHEE